MYRVILIPLENSAADQTILDHVKPLARAFGSRLLLINVANGVVARNFDALRLAESDEIKAGRAYLEQRAVELGAEGFEVAVVLALGQPSDEIIKLSRNSGVDLIAMATHGHRGLGDLIHGSTVFKVRHVVDVPVLLLKAKV